MQKECGMKYIVVTSKHHEGFAMFKSRADKFNIVDATPFGRDVMAELAEACYKHDMKLGLYYSQDLDWHEKNGGGYLSNHIPNAGTTWDNSWDFPDEAHKDFTECFENKIMPQVEEILTGYGDLCLIWFDVPMTINESQSRRIYEAVKKYQPNCLINSRLGNGAYDYVSLGDNEIPDKLEDTTGKAVDMNSIGGFKPSPYGLYETAATLNDTWGFSYHDHNWKTPEFIRSTREKLNGMGINYLINGPRPRWAHNRRRTTHTARRSKVKNFWRSRPQAAFSFCRAAAPSVFFQRMGSRPPRGRIRIKRRL